MKRYEVRVLSIGLLTGSHSEWLHGQYRWRWCASVACWMVATAPTLFSINVPRCLPLLRVVK